MNLERARVICRGYPAALCCAKDTIIRGDEMAVWGGSSGRQRRRIRKLWQSGVDLDAAIAHVMPHLSGELVVAGIVELRPRPAAGVAMAD